MATGTTDVPFGWVTTSRPCASMIARRPRRGGNAAAGMSAGRVVEAVLVDAFGRVVVVEERVLLVLAPGARVVVVVLPVTVEVVARERVVVEDCAVTGLRS